MQNRETASFCTGCGAALNALVAGAVLGGRYRIDAPLGQGGMGVVWRAWDLRLECACAIKEMNAAGHNPDERAENIARFKREAQTLRGLAHPGLPRVFDFFDEDGRHVLVQDFIEGDNFHALLAREGAPGLPEDQVRAVALEVLDILAYLHAQSPPILHRDIKPANLMRRAGVGQIMLVDFGIARNHEGRTSTAIGTPQYSSPEQYAGKAAPISDVYSLGATMHHLLTGQAPTPFQFPAPAGTSPALQRVLARATALNPRERYASAEEMRRDLAAQSPVNASSPAGASPEGTTGPGASSFPPPTVQFRRSAAASKSHSSPFRPSRPPSTQPIRSGSSPSQAHVSAQVSTSHAAPSTPGSSPSPPVYPLPAGFWHRGKNRQGFDEIQSECDGTVLIAIPAGAFDMGAETGGEDDERPRHRVEVGGFWTARTPVTVGQYRHFVEATGHRPSSDVQRMIRGELDTFPARHVSWHDALAYCAWAEMRLPTEAEWEYASRGVQGFTYPWGDVWDRARCRSSVGGGWGSALSPSAVDAHPAGASPFGCLDMVGNVWEWCATRYALYPYDASDGREDLSGDQARVLRGGAWNLIYPDRFRVSNRNWSSPAFHGEDWGFRLARSV